MKNPYITSKGHARAQISIQTNSSRELFDCMIDTGFSSGVALGSRVQNQIPKQLVATQDFELADGSLIRMDVYKISFKFRDIVFSALAIFTEGGDNLLGIEFLRNFKFILDLQNNRVQLQ